MNLAVDRHASIFGLKTSLSIAIMESATPPPTLGHPRKGVLSMADDMNICIHDKIDERAQDWWVQPFIISIAAARHTSSISSLASSGF
jgi:hypothetical protein